MLDKSNPIPNDLYRIVRNDELSIGDTVVLNGNHTTISGSNIKYIRECSRINGALKTVVVIYGAELFRQKAIKGIATT